MRAASQYLAERLLRTETPKGVLELIQHALASCKIWVEPRHQSRDGHTECGGKYFQIANSNFLSSILQVRDETSIHSRAPPYRPVSILSACGGRAN